LGFQGVFVFKKGVSVKSKSKEKKAEEKKKRKRKGKKLKSNEPSETKHEPTDDGSPYKKIWDKAQSEFEV
jgi:hypothetical protein